MIKFILVIALLFAGFSGYAYQTWYQETQNKYGQTFYRINNPTDSPVYCSVYVESPYYFNDFTIPAYSSSRWYPRPPGYIQSGCE